MYDSPIIFGKYGWALVIFPSVAFVSCTTVRILDPDSEEFGGNKPGGGRELGCKSRERNVCVVFGRGAWVAIHHLPPNSSRTQLAFKYLPFPCSLGSTVTRVRSNGATST